MKPGIVVAVSVSEKKGTRKGNVPFAELKNDFGIIGDAHAGLPRKQISLLAEESIDKMRSKGLKVGPGDFAENITTRNIDLLNLTPGDKLRIGESVVLEITELGKECHKRCAIYYAAGDCVMPTEGIFARVLKGGIIRAADRMEAIKNV